MIIDKNDHKEFLIKMLVEASKHVPVQAQSWALAAEVLDALIAAKVEENI